ncbi:MAG: hypothetical protein MJ252_14710, partial [archaeon]|nr:hypothetical protein [archaeon]
MLTLQISKQRFSLYHLDEGELFIKDYLASMSYYFPPSKSKDTLNGFLYLGSRSLIFEPEDKNISLVRFPFKYFTNIPFLTPFDSTLNFSIQKIVEITANFTEPYKNYEIPEKEEENQKVQIKLKFEKIEVVSKIISELIEKFNKKESCFEFDSLDYLGALYSFKFDLTLIKSVKERFIYDGEIFAKQQLPLIEVPGVLRVTDIRIYFQPIFKINSKKSINVKFASMTQLFKRRLHLKNIGIEIVTPKKSLL